jgi:uncharacterized protein (DUF849 family)
MENQKTIITCAVTGAATGSLKYGTAPITPAEIARASIDAAKAGAAIVHIHVRDPITGEPSLDLELYREVVARIKDSECDVLINLTTGAGARFVPGTPDQWIGKGSMMRMPDERVRHIVELRPDLCSLDMGTLNFGSGALVNVSSHIEAMAAIIVKTGVKPELEVFDSGHIATALDMLERGLLGSEPFFQIVLGAGASAPATPEMLLALRNMLPVDSKWAAFGIGQKEFPVVAQAWLLGGHVRVGLEDNLYLERGVLAKSNAELVEKAVRMLSPLGASIASPTEAAEILGITR